MNPDYHPSHTDTFAMRQPSQLDKCRLRTRQVDYVFIDAVESPLWNLHKGFFLYPELIFAMVFGVDLACYDQTVQTASSLDNKLKTILHQFGTLVNSQRLRDRGVILLFLGWDTFTSKLRSSPLKNHFPGFDGGHDSSLALDYILGQFISISDQRTRGVYAHVCNIGDGSTLSFLTRQFRELEMAGAPRDYATVYEAY